SYQIAERLGDEELTLTFTFWMTSGMISQDPRRALEQLEYVIESAHKYGRRELEAHALATTAVAHARLGEFAEAQDAVQRAYAAARAANLPVNQADVALLAALAYFDMGDVQRGLEHSKWGTEKALSAQGLECAMYGLYTTGLGNLRTRDLVEAQRAFESSLKLLTDHVSEIEGSEHVINQVRAGLAITQFFSGRIEAINDMERTLKNAEALGDEYTVARIAQALGEGYTQLGDFERAERHLNTALDYYRRNDMRPYQARVLQSLVYWYEQQGRGAEAEQARAEVHQLMEELHLPPVRPLSSEPLGADEPRPAGSAER
ncbi:MAG: tetratricopeptide repeat protein, partial [Actinomycetota bacterium]|nr:tetratricopeptide repeat protein [Actinomycetota bacterium]